MNANQPPASGKQKKSTVQERLKNLLNIESVQKVYVVDEQIAETYPFDDFAGFVEAAPEQQLQAIEIGGISFKDRAIALVRIEEIWTEWSDEQKREAIATIAVFSNSNMASDAQQPNKLKKLFDEDMVAFITPVEWKTEMETIVAGLNEPNKVLVLFDEELQQEDGRRGRDLIQEVKDRNWQKAVVSVLFSNIIPSYKDELSQRDTIIAEMAGGLTEQDFFALSKKRSDKGEDFADGIKKALLNGYCEKIKIASVKVLENAFSQAIEKVKKLDTYDFDNVVLASSYSEGIWEGFTFQRIARIFYEDAIHTEMVNQNYIPQVNTDIRASKRIRTEEFKPIESALYTEKTKLRHQEFYLDGTVINPLYFPIENGDIFEITRNEQKLQFILIGQECDLAVRADGQGKPEKEGSRKLQVGTLLRIDYTIGLNKQGANFQLDYFTPHTWKHAWAEFSNPVFVDLDFLDLTAFHPDGLAQMKLAVKAIDGNLFSFAWEKRYAIVNELLKSKMGESQNKREMLMTEHKGKLDSDIFPIFSFPKNLLSPTFDGETISLDIKRTKRLRPPYSKNLLEKFTRYQSRGADAHDFAK